MRQCPKCGYVRQPNDDQFYGPDECPKCGTIYIKYQAHLAQRQEEEEEKEKATEKPPPKPPPKAEGISQKTCQNCGQSFETHLFGALPWNCPTCEGRYWEQQTKRRQNLILTSAVALILLVGVGIGTLSVRSAQKRREIARQEQAEKLRLQQQREAQRKRDAEERAAQLRAQKEQEEEKISALEEQGQTNELVKQESFAAYTALKRIDEMMLSGASFRNYDKALQEARRELDLLRPYLDQSKGLESIFALYQEAGELWQTKHSGDPLKLCQEYSRIVSEREFTGGLKSKDECLRSCESLSETGGMAKRREVYETVKPYVEELQRKLWSEAALFMKAFEQRWGFP